MTDATQLTPEEIKQYREQLKDYPEALEVLDLIEESDRDLEYAVRRLAMRADFEQLKADDDTFWQKAIDQARLLVCQDGVRDNFAPNFLGGLIGFLSASSEPLLVVVATPIAIYIVKETIEDFCNC